jgi:poly [ADP-ribose] polymerase 1
MSKSKLAREVKELISMIFDVDAMNAAMKEFEIDLEKMPLGHFTHNHILKAYNVLTDLQRVLEERQGSSNENAKTVPKGKFIEFTNRFYTLIPHATGLGTPPMLDNMQILKVGT